MIHLLASLRSCLAVLLWLISVIRVVSRWFRLYTQVMILGCCIKIIQQSFMYKVDLNVFWLIFVPLVTTIHTFFQTIWPNNVPYNKKLSFILFGWCRIFYVWIYRVHCTVKNSLEFTIPHSFSLSCLFQILYSFDVKN